MRKRRVGASFFGVRAFGAGGLTLDLGESHDTLVDGDVGPIERGDFDTPDTLTFDQNHRMPHHEGDFDAEAEVGNTLKELDRGRMTGPLAPYSDWGGLGSDGTTGIHLGHATINPSVLDTVTQFVEARGWTAERPGYFVARNHAAKRFALAELVSSAHGLRCKFHLRATRAWGSGNTMQKNWVAPVDSTNATASLEGDFARAEQWLRETSAWPVAPVEPKPRSRPTRFDKNEEPSRSIFARLASGGWNARAKDFEKLTAERRALLTFNGTGRPTGMKFGLYLANPTGGAYAWRGVKHFTLALPSEPEAAISAAAEMLGQVEQWLAGRTAAGVPGLGGSARAIASQLARSIARYQEVNGVTPLPKERREYIHYFAGDDTLARAKEALARLVSATNTGGTLKLSQFLPREAVRTEAAWQILATTKIYLGTEETMPNVGGYLNPSSGDIWLRISTNMMLAQQAENLTDLESTIAHEIRHAIDWAYDPKGFMRKRHPGGQENRVERTKDWWQKYLANPTELMSWSGNVAHQLDHRPRGWEDLKAQLARFTVSVKDLYGRVTEGRAEPTIVQTPILDLIQPDARPRFLQMILKAYDELHPSGGAGVNPWHVRREDTVNRKRIPPGFMPQLLEVAFLYQKRDRMADEPDWKTWVKNRTSAQLEMEIENNYNAYQLLKKLPRNQLGEYPDLEDMIERWRTSGGVPYAPAPEPEPEQESWQEYMTRRETERARPFGAQPITAGRRQVNMQNPYLFDVDPNELLFTESDQNRGPYEGDASKPILAYEDASKRLHVLDGHHRTLLARSEGRDVRAVVMPEAVYQDFVKEGLHPTEMMRAFARYWADQKRQAQHHQPTVAVDLDGTILEEQPGWAAQGILGPPLPGAMKALRELESLGWKILICTARFSFGGDAELKSRIEQHLRGHGVPFSAVWTGPKPPADYYIDNRAIPFTGDWDAVLLAVTQQGVSAPEPDEGEHDAGTGVVDWIDDPGFGDDGMGSRQDRSISRAPGMEGLVH